MPKGKSRPPRKVARDAGTGQFVSLGYAKRHRRTTVVETIKPTSRKK